MPGLLQPRGIVLVVLAVAVSFFLAYRWYRRHPGMPKLHLDVAAVTLLSLLTGGFFWRPLTESGVTMPAGGGDLASFYYPTYWYASEQIKSGTLPLWNPHLFSGMPLAADVQSGLFYPLNWILYLFVHVEYGSLLWLLIAHYWLASVFMYVFLRDVGISRLGALAGGVVFAFCGFMTAHLGHMPMVLVATWIPAILWALRRALLDRTPIGWVMSIVAGLLMAVSLLAGHVQIFAYGLLAAGLLWLYMVQGSRFKVQGSKRRSTLNLELWAKGALALGVALGIGAVQLLPSLELSEQSVRASVSYEEASEFPNQPVSWLNLLLPRVYGGNPTSYFPGQWQNTENWGYSGVVPLALAAAALLMRRKRMVGFFALVVALAFVIMVGDLSIVGAWLYKFAPGFSKLRDAGRALVLLGLGLAGLAAFGLDALMLAFRARTRDRARRAALWWLAGLTGVLAVVVLVVMPLLYGYMLSGAGRGAEYGLLPGAVNDLGMLALWLALLAGVGWAAYTRRTGARLAGAAILLVLVLDIFSPNSRFNPTTTDILAGYKHYNAINFLYKQTRGTDLGIPLRIDSDTPVHNVWQPSTALLNDLYDTGGAFNPLKLSRYDLLWDRAKRNPNTPLYDLTGAAFQVITPTTIYDEEQKWELAERHPGFEIYRNQNAMPRAFLVHASEIRERGEESVGALERFEVEPRHTVILERGEATPSEMIGTAEAAIRNLPTSERVLVIEYTPNTVKIAVWADAPGWVVLTDAYHPGWKASIARHWKVDLDWRSVPVEPAYYAYRAVRVDSAGEHTILMQFRPDTWVWGRLISLATLAVALGALALLLLRAWRRRRG